MSTVIQFGTTPVQEYLNTRIGENDYFMRLDFNQRTADWRISMQNNDTQEWLCVTRRLSPGSAVAIMPDGQLFCEGPEEYTLDDLGGALRLRFYTDAELTTLLSILRYGEDPAPRIL